MRTITTAFLAALFLAATLPHGGTALAAGNGRGNPHGCVNPAGHVRGWCKQDNGHTRNANSVVISGTVLAVNGDLVQFREDDGTTVTIDQRNLLNSGQPLSVGGHFALHGYFSNNIFIAQANGAYDGGNGYPNRGANASVHGIVTSINGDRLTLLQGLFTTITVNDQQALNNGSAQNLYVGRNLTAYGYWSGSTFYATSLG